MAAAGSFFFSSLGAAPRPLRRLSRLLLLLSPIPAPSPAPLTILYPHPFPLTSFQTLLLSSSFPFPFLRFFFFPHLPPPSHSSPPSQFPHRHLHQLKTVHLLLSGRSWRRSSPAHAAAPAGPAALPSAGQVEPEPESPHSPPTSPPPSPRRKLPPAGKSKVVGLGSQVSLQHVSLVSLMKLVNLMKLVS